MADEENLDTGTIVAENVTDTPKPESKKRKPAETPTTRTTAAFRKRQANEAVQTEAPATRRRYSDAERAEKVAAIDADIAKGATLKASAKNAGVTEQSYYQWKKATKATPESAGETADSLDLADLIALDAENQRLRAQLASKLRAENEELRKRLGQA